MRVALIVMPFASMDGPSLAAGLLQAALLRRGIECTTKFFNVTLARMMGVPPYHLFARGVSTTVLAGEWAFSQAYFGERLSTWERYRTEVLDVPIWGMDRDTHDRVLALRELAPVLVRVALESNDWTRYDLVGFTSTFEQTMPGLCLARAIRERSPRTRIAFGGANFERGMGRPYMAHFPFIDYVSTGEADLSFPALCEHLRDGRPGVPPGFLYRDGGGVRESPRRRDEGFVPLDDLPTPDYSDYFRVLGATMGHDALSPWLPVEASRGCWWGEHAHCTFCGLNGDGMAFRKKSFRRVVDEVDELTDRHGPRLLQFADNILGMGYFDDLLPFWSSRGDSVPKFFEIKSNLKRSHVKLLRDAGVTSIQAGVESLADGTLRIMQKGVTGAQNIALLRYCQELGVRAHWNVLFGFPGEDPRDHAATLELLQKMTHMAPPDACAPIRMDRFSPNHARFREHGFTRIAPMPAYRHVLPFSDEELAETAYYFLYEHPGHDEAMALGGRLIEFTRLWQQKSASGERGELRLVEAQGGHVVVDSRFNLAPETRRLDPLEVAALYACDAPATRRVALRRASRRAPGVGAEKLEAALARLVERGVIAEVGSHLVTLALLPGERPLERPARDELTLLEGGG
jgi:ribosomal peptide maturation radical SAM protein 1